MHRSRQEIFDLAYRGLASQGFQKSTADGTTDETTSCRYRGANGLKCAIGHLIPDEEYNETHEGLGGGSIRIRTVANISFEHATFARMLQSAHDRGSSPDEIKHRLHSLAHAYMLNIPKIDDEV